MLEYALKMPKKLSLSKIQIYDLFFYLYSSKIIPFGKKENHLRDQWIIILKSKKDSSSKGSSSKGSEIKGSSS